jgi:uncharacterized protein YbbC (DUF1343 family)
LLAGVTVTSETFTPDSDPYAHKPCHGLHLTVTDRTQFDPVRTGIAVARALRHLYPRAWEFAKLDRLLVHPGAMRAIDANLPLEAIVTTYGTELAAFAAKREKYLLYDSENCGSSPVP